MVIRATALLAYHSLSFIGLYNSLITPAWLISCDGDTWRGILQFCSPCNFSEKDSSLIWHTYGDSNNITIAEQISGGALVSAVLLRMVSTVLFSVLLLSGVNIKSEVNLIVLSDIMAGICQCFTLGGYVIAYYFPWDDDECFELGFSYLATFIQVIVECSIRIPFVYCYLKEVRESCRKQSVRKPGGKDQRPKKVKKGEKCAKCRMQQDPYARRKLLEDEW